jgi:ankyrin repeat protein
MKRNKTYYVFLFFTLICAILSSKQTDSEAAKGLELLLQNNIEFTEVNFYRYLNKDRSEVIGAFLDAGFEVDKRNQASQTPLMVASEKGCFKVAELLLKSGADINAADSDSSTALMYAANKKRVRIAELLIAWRANVNLQNEHGWTALMFAIDSGNKAVIDALITIDTDAMLSNNDNKTARDFAKEHRFDKLPQYIIDKITYLQNQKNSEQKKKTAKPGKF